MKPGALKYLNITDEFTKEALTIEVARSLTSDDAVLALERIVAYRRCAPTLLRMKEPNSLRCPLETAQYVCVDGFVAHGLKVDDVMITWVSAFVLGGSSAKTNSLDCVNQGWQTA